MVNHSQDKDQFMKVVIKRMVETQSFEDELKEVSELNSVIFAQNQELVIKRMVETQSFEDELKEVSEINSVIFAQNQELKAQLAKESQAKDGKPPLSS
jgi:bifunctional N-acetylglucosamine-1-phosphate-uridyltransferase/glucosamine-1-phosphate-acetyltransferase GlmU-like protein